MKLFKNNSKSNQNLVPASQAKQLVLNVRQRESIEALSNEILKRAAEGYDWLSLNRFPLISDEELGQKGYRVEYFDQARKGDNLIRHVYWDNITLKS